MLPSELLRTKISKGRIRPIYVPLDSDNATLASEVTDVYNKCVGTRKGALIDNLFEIESQGYDFKLVRGLAALLERRSTFEIDSVLNPVQARKAVFSEASKARVSTSEQRATAIKRASDELRVSPEALERALFSDVEEELILKEFRPFPSALGLLRQYNLSVTQTLLFKALRVEFSASGNWKNIFRNVKRLGLIYSVEKEAKTGGDGRFRVSLDGPLSLFKMTERYGTSIAKLLPQIVAADSWDIKAEILLRNRGGKVFIFEGNSGELKNVVADADASTLGKDDLVSHRPRRGSSFDSSTEERFSKSFLSFATGWELRREPEPLQAGTHVMIPDFSFEKHGIKVYLEVVGFWTPDYLERKIAKLRSIAEGNRVDMIIAANESLACSKLEGLKGRALVIYYKNAVPLKPIVEYLREKESSVINEQVDRLGSRGEGEESTVAVNLRGGVVSLEEVAAQKGVSLASIRIALRNFEQEGYVRTGDIFVSKAKLKEIEERLAGVEKLAVALRIIEDSGVKQEGGKVLDALGYTSTWEGMDMDTVRISKTLHAPAAAKGAPSS